MKILGIPVEIDPSLPPGTIELRSARSRTRIIGIDPGVEDGDKTQFTIGHTDSQGNIWLDDCTFISEDAMIDALRRCGIPFVIDVKGQVVK